MLAAITTTHAIPKRLPSVRISIRTALIVCPYCLESLGASLDSAERKSIEDGHKCLEKAAAKRPAISLPFS
jgi:hypothetical protein